MGLEILTLGSSKTYTRESLLGGGAVVGKNVTISSITPIDGGNRVTFSYTLDNGTVKTSTMDVMNGVDGEPGYTPVKGTDYFDGQDGFSPTAKIEKVGDTATITITDKDGTTTATIKDGQGGTGGSGEENKIDSISVNGVNVAIDENKNVDITVPSIDGLAKTEDIPTKVSELTNDSGYLTEHQDISGKVDKVDGKSLIADTEIERLASVDNYNDTQIKTQIQAVANGLMDSVGYSADYKTIDIIAKNGVKKSVNVAPIISHASITELSDVDTTNKATGKALVYNATTSKHEYADVSGTDEKVKMDSSTDAKYLGELLDNVTIANENGKLKVKKLDGQEVTITEINYLKGLTMNVMDLVNMFSNGGVKIINTPVATYAELLTLDKSSFIEGISYLVYVLADENHDNAKTTYLVDKDSETPTYFGFADSQRDFTTNPIDLATEITGKLGISNMDSDAIKALFTVDDTYKTETATNNAFSTHGAKALYDELLLAIGNKANSSDLTAHKDDTDIHVSTEDRTKWDSAKTHADSAHAPSNAQENVLETVKVNGTALEVSNKAVNVTVPTTVAELTDSADYAKKTDIPTTLPANGGNANTVNNHNVESDVPVDAKFTDTIYDDTEVKGSIEELSSNLDTLEFGEVAGGKNLLDIEEKIYSNSVTDEKTSFIATLKVNNTWAGAVNVTGNGIFSITFDITDSNINNIKLYHSGSHADITLIYKDIYLDVGKYTMSFDAIGCNPQVVNGIKIQKIQIEKGTQATEYEPYIPSVKMLTEENEQQNTEAMDLKMLGWTVPKECPIQNYVDSDGVFHQRVGRVDLGSLSWNYISSRQFFYADLAGGKIGSENAYCRNYNLSNATAYGAMANGEFRLSLSSETVSRVYVKDTSYTDATTLKQALQGVYIYYELAKEILIKVDGNEAVTKVNEILSVIGKCKNLLNPTLQTTTQNGVTCTNNGDGTYTLNGTASSDIVLALESYKSYTGKEKFRLVGCPNGGGESKYYLAFSPYNAEENRKDIGSGVTFNDLSTSNKYAVAIIVLNGTTLTNITFKPMLVNLDEHQELSDITYDDFVPYTGDGETLTHDVAEIKNDLSTKIYELAVSELYLCVSGKTCVLTLNGYNLTGSTNFSKLAEYPPYLIARNVVSKEDEVCMIYVDQDGNISASDLQVASSVTGKMFGEVSWIANI